MFKLVVLTCMLAAANAQWLGGWASPLAYGAYGASPLAYGAYGAYGVAPNYRGLAGSLAPGQPANILAADGRPLDTLDVNLDRSAHLTAKALEGHGVHLLKKRSIVAPVVASPLIARSALGYSAGWASPYAGAWATPYASAWGSPYGYASAWGAPYGGLVRSW